MRCVALAALAGGVCAPVAMGSVVVSDVASDAELEMQTLNNALVAWEAEGRFGDLGGAAERELGVGLNTAVPPADGAQVDWVNAQSDAVNSVYSFAINWDGASTLTLDVDGIDASGAAVHETLVYNLPGVEDNIGTIFIRVAANSATTSAMDWSVEGASGSLDAGGMNASSDLVRIVGSELTDGFTLSGTFAFGWDSVDDARNSRPSWQIKGVRGFVPGPGTAAIAAFALAGVARRRRG